jgi:hypothetical protein
LEIFKASGYDYAVPLAEALLEQLKGKAPKN